MTNRPFTMPFPRPLVDDTPDAPGLPGEDLWGELQRPGHVLLVAPARLLPLLTTWTLVRAVNRALRQGAAGERCEVFAGVPWEQDRDHFLLEIVSRVLPHLAARFSLDLLDVAVAAPPPSLLDDRDLSTCLVLDAASPVPADWASVAQRLRDVAHRFARDADAPPGRVRRWLTAFDSDAWDSLPDQTRRDLEHTATALVRHTSGHDAKVTRLSPVLGSARIRSDVGQSLPQLRIDWLADEGLLAPNSDAGGWSYHRMQLTPMVRQSASMMRDAQVSSRDDLAAAIAEQPQTDDVPLVDDVGTSLSCQRWCGAEGVFLLRGTFEVDTRRGEITPFEAPSPTAKRAVWLIDARHAPATLVVRHPSIGELVLRFHERVVEVCAPPTGLRVAARRGE